MFSVSTRRDSGADCLGDHQVLVVRGPHHGNIGGGQRNRTSPARRPPPHMVRVPRAPPAMSRQPTPPFSVQNTSQPGERPESRADTHDQNKKERRHHVLRIVLSESQFIVTERAEKQVQHFTLSDVTPLATGLLPPQGTLPTVPGPTRAATRLAA